MPNSPVVPELKCPIPERPDEIMAVLIRPTVEQVYGGADRIVKIEIREANLYGLDAPKKSEVMAAVPRA